MKYVNSKYYVEVKDKQYIIHPIEKTILRERKEPKRARTHYQVQIEAKFMKHQKDI